MADALAAADWAGLFGHFLLLSLLSIGGAIATASEMHRYVVLQRGWLTDADFTTAIALAQAAPGPNVLFVAVIGWQVAGLPGAAVAMLGILLPSTTLALAATRWGSARRESRGVRVFVAGMAPLTVGLLGASGWILAEPSRGSTVALALIAGTVLAMMTTRLSPIWLVGAGAVVGALALR